MVYLMPLTSATLPPMLNARAWGEDNFNWVVETAASYAIDKAMEHKPGQDNLTWGEYVKRGATKQSLI